MNLSIIYRIINGAGTTSGFITPLIVAYYTQERVITRSLLETFKTYTNLFQSTADEWSWIFLIGAIAYIASAILFILFGSGNIQYWNDLENKDTECGEPSSISKN